MIRNATLQDLPDIVAIYNFSIPGRKATADTQPISVESRISWFHQHHKNRPLWVIEKNQKIAGWLGLQDFLNGRCAYQTTVEISLYTHPDYHRQGIAQELLNYALSRCQDLNISTLVAFIFGHNEPSIQLFKKYNFQPWGYLPTVAQLDGRAIDLAIYGLCLKPSVIE